MTDPTDAMARTPSDDKPEGEQREPAAEAPRAGEPPAH